MSVTGDRRQAVLRQGIQEHAIVEAFAALRGVGVEPILLKGWSVARSYPDPVRRQLGDIDLAIPAAAIERARKSCAGNIDWHKAEDLPAGFIERSILVPLENARIRILGAEDNLHYVAVHMLRHACWSEQWLEDVEVLVTCRPATFDWNLCLTDDPVRQDWIRSALVLARELRGTDISDTPAQNHRVKPWVLASIRKAWSNQDIAANQPPEGIEASMKRPWRIPQAIKARWPNPLTAAIVTGRSFQSNPTKAQLTYTAKLVTRKVSGPPRSNSK